MELFYYTTTDTMRFILRQGDIFATNIRYMNDSEEYINGLNEIYQLSQKTSLLKKWISERALDNDLLQTIQNTFSVENLEENKQNMEYYSISFCKKNDLLSQWAIYAKESGVSIKMDFEKDSYKFFTEGIDEDNKAKWSLFPHEVYYFTYNSMKDNKNEYKKMAYKILDQLYAENAKDQTEWKKEQWRYVSTLVKRYDFYQEEECRLVFEPNQSAYSPCIQYRPDKKVLKPYLDIECDGGWPIWEIMIGPGFNQSIVYDSVKHFLNHTAIKVGINSVEEYANRVQQYLAPFDPELKKCKEYIELGSQLQQSDWLAHVDMEEAKIFFSQQLRMIGKVVCRDAGYKEDIKKYFANHCFTESGVVLTKSSIPYIF